MASSQKRKQPSEEPPIRERKRSKDLPPNLSELMNKLVKHAASFISLFEDNKPKMTQIVREFEKFTAELKKMQNTMDDIRRPRTVERSVFAGPLGMFGLRGVAIGAETAVRTAVAYSVNIGKVIKQTGIANKVEEQGKEFMEIVEPLKENLEEIKTTCEKMEQRSTELQVGLTLSDVEEFRWLITRVPELKEMSRETLSVTVEVINIMKKMLLFVVKIVRDCLTLEEDKELRDTIYKSADQCQKVVDKFDKMKNELRNFTGSKEKK
ncbi:uncharacterized protein LOC122968170 [Thunnus albacares]|uniref:uncharacterized protein LOC122968170 n=1 Tax=Thunnus albacares TaxID=8236 RepID=UPI001CF63C13|nr:uncharacterized protein LOC122968170 [Thunnus albacares]